MSTFRDSGTGLSGVYADKTSFACDNFQAHDTTARDPLVPRFVGSADASINKGTPRGQAATRNLGAALAMVRGLAVYRVGRW